MKLQNMMQVYKNFEDNHFNYINKKSQIHNYNYCNIGKLYYNLYSKV